MVTAMVTRMAMVTAMVTRMAWVSPYLQALLSQVAQARGRQGQLQGHSI
jgi:hypothetical protein